MIKFNLQIDNIDRILTIFWERGKRMTANISGIRPGWQQAGRRDFCFDRLEAKGDKYEEKRKK